MCGSIFGGGNKVKTPEIQKVDPAVSNVTSSEIQDTEEGSENSRRKKRQGYAATRLATILSGATNTKDTLG